MPCARDLQITYDTRTKLWFYIARKQISQKCNNFVPMLLMYFIVFENRYSSWKTCFVDTGRVKNAIFQCTPFFFVGLQVSAKVGDYTGCYRDGTT